MNRTASVPITGALHAYQKGIGFNSVLNMLEYYRYVVICIEHYPTIVSCTVNKGMLCHYLITKVVI